MKELTFAELDQLEAERQAKRRECVERLSNVLAKEFSLNELRFIWGSSLPPSPLLVEAFEIARTKAKK